MTAERVSSLSEAKFEVDAAIEDNILNRFQLPTYHFRLYMMSDQAVRDKDFGPSSNKKRVVIAESGVTSIEIDNVEIYSVSGISKEAGIGKATNFSFQLTEPFGATLLDEIVNAANFLGIENFAKCPYFLELSFKGRNPGDESAQRPGSEEELKRLIWVWPLILTKMAMNVNAGGSVYELEAVIYGDLAYTNQASDLEEVFTTEVGTVGEFFDALEIKLNSREVQKTESATSFKFADTYKFFIDEEIAKEKIVPSDDNVQNRAASFDEVDGKMKIAFQPGTSIDRIVDNILSLTDLFQKKIKGTETPDELSSSGKGEEVIFQDLYRVIADAQMGEYDTTRQDYQRHFRYLIIPYQMSTLITPSNTQSVMGSKERLAALQDRGLITKVYDYLYTGLNTEVLDFDLTFNFNWYAALPLQAGATNASDAEPQAKSAEAAAASAEDSDRSFRDDLKKFFADANAAANALNGFDPNDIFADLISGLTAKFNDTDLADKIQETKVKLEDLKPESIIGSVPPDFSGAQPGIEKLAEFVPGFPATPAAFIADATGGLGLGGFDDFAERFTNELRIRLDEASKNPAQQFLRDVPPTIEDPTIGEKQVTFIKPSYNESTPGARHVTGEYASSRGQNMLSALFEQAESPVSADLLTIDLKIKGDPYWLEPGPIGFGKTPRSALDVELAKRRIKATDINDNTNQEAGLVESFTGNETSARQTYMVFRNFTPQQFDAETGLTPAGKKSVNALNGIYAVRTVSHSFSAGQFTQELNAIRDVNINLDNVNLDFFDKVIDSNSNTPATEEPVTDSNSDTPIDSNSNTTVGP